MKNSAIALLIDSNYSRISSDETIKDINVEFLFSQGLMEVFKVLLYTKSTIGGSQDIITEFDVRINNTDNDYEGNYCVDSNDVMTMLNQQYLKNDDKLTHCIRTAPGVFTYYLNTKEGIQEENLEVAINQIERNCY